MSRLTRRCRRIKASCHAFCSRKSHASLPLPLSLVVMPTGNGTAVREARLGDVAELARLRWDFRSASQAVQSWDSFSAEFQRWFQSAYVSSRWVVAVAESNPGRLCGCIFLQCVEKVPNPGATIRSWGYVTNSYMAPEFRSRGLGGVMLRLVVAAARARSLEFLIVWPSPEAESFYQRAGFLPVVQQHSSPGDSPPLELLLA